MEVIPWATDDSTYVKMPNKMLEADKTVFVGGLHGMLTAAGLATVMYDLFQNVIYAGELKKIYRIIRNVAKNSTFQLLTPTNPNIPWDPPESPSVVSSRITWQSTQAMLGSALRNSKRLCKSHHTSKTHLLQLFCLTGTQLLSRTGIKKTEKQNS